MKEKKRRLSARMKQHIVMQVLRGDDLELVSREHGVTAALITQWRDEFLEAGMTALKGRGRNGEPPEVANLHKKIGEITMDNELLRDKIRRMEAGYPLARRRSSK